TWFAVKKAGSESSAAPFVPLAVVPSAVPLLVALIPPRAAKPLSPVCPELHCTSSSAAKGRKKRVRTWGIGLTSLWQGRRVGSMHRIHIWCQNGLIDVLFVYARGQ